MEDRTRSVVLQITEDMSLTEDMDDVEAMILLEWGSEIARKLTLTTVEMTDDQAGEALDRHIVGLRQTMRRINTLIGSKRDGSSVDDIAMKAGRIFDAAAEMPVLQLDKPEDINQFAAQLSFLSLSATLRAILTRLSPDGLDHHE